MKGRTPCAQGRRETREPSPVRERGDSHLPPPPIGFPGWGGGPIQLGQSLAEHTVASIRFRALCSNRPVLVMPQAVTLLIGPIEWSKSIVRSSSPLTLAGAWPAERLRDAEPAMLRLAPARTPPEQAHDIRAMHEAALC